MLNRKFVASLVLLIMSTLFISCTDTQVKEEVEQQSNLTELSGYAVSLTPMSYADVTVADIAGKTAMTKTDKNGKYSVVINGMDAPFLVSVTEKGISNINDNSKQRGKAVAALVASVKERTVNVANVNPITDAVVSDVAKTLSFQGPVGLIKKKKKTTEGITAEVIAEKTAEQLVLINKALEDTGIDVASYNPVTTPMNDKLFEIYSLIRHNRSYHTKSGKVSGTLIFDLNFHPLSKNDYLDYKKSLELKKELADKNVTRVFIAGDSTLSNYPSERAPRAGWAQVFQNYFKDDANVLVVNAAISGRSSRSYINEGWLDMIEEYMQPGDYLFIEFGHNDEKSGGTKGKERDAYDRKNTATYPNDAMGDIQGSDDMSFQRWLEKYVDLAKSKQVTPILLTPITRVKKASDKTTGVFPIESSTHIVYREKSSGKYVGNYSQTIKDTAKANGIEVIDLDTKTINWVNSIGHPAWKNYWLAVDPADYPYYKAGKTGNYDKPDSTHLQENGALKVSSFVVESIKSNEKLAELAKLLR